MAYRSRTSKSRTYRSRSTRGRKSYGRRGRTARKRASRRSQRPQVVKVIVEASGTNPAQSLREMGYAASAPKPRKSRF